MRYVPLREAEPGMVLAADLYDSVGRTLIGCHCELTESYLEKLEAYGFDGIYIEDKLSEGITIESVITPQLRQEGQERIRACDIGSYMMDPDPDTGEAVRSINEFTRLAIPRRVYTQSHFDLAVEAIHNVWQRREELQHGYRIVWGPNVLRHFQATLAPIDA